ncbi:histone acetyltransferase Hat1 [Schizosaccharomyces japonicus yFS275]|uniref:Histone acetyltransferase type B catalytic subunit n=1 Tax=Schizosaccharomyces japonicus (strain yFS275 / FY16936) TaxID=402676 RepID=B6JWA3_SCHJY|nr:histone acetyltransferase Hat1 [Schizosaccharomyces japonicus yFS275]EEB05654.2 histone acetyltransferase Hat1 [Schizosaccharomyces japonicus yFS275]
MSTTDEWSSNSNDAIHIQLVKPNGEVDFEFHPANTYSIFGDAETIYGYKGLNVTIKFLMPWMKPSLTITSNETIPSTSGVTPTDISSILKEYIPFTNTDGEATASSDTLSFLPKEPLCSYVKNEKTFKIFKTSVTAAEKLMQNLQVFPLFFIDGGSFIDLEDPQWFVYFVFEVQDEQLYLRGYSTVYHYYVWKKDDSSALRARISQFIILPPFQHQGHGSKLYKTIVGDFMGDKNIVDFAVEDSSESFDALRDRCDFTRIAESGLFDREEFRAPLSTQWISLHRLPYKLNKRQFSRCCELALLSKLNNQLASERKAYRLTVKERIFRQNIDVLLQLEKPERLEKLQEAYKNQLDEYKRILAEGFPIPQAEKGDMPPAKRLKTSS